MRKPYPKFKSGGHWRGYPIPVDQNPLGLREYEYVIPKRTANRLGGNVLRAANGDARLWIGADNGQWFDMSNAFTNIQLTKEEEVAYYNDLKPGDAVTLISKLGGSATVKVAKIVDGLLIVSEEGTVFVRSKWEIVKVIPALPPEPKLGSVVRITQSPGSDALIVRAPDGWRDLINGRFVGGAYTWARMNEIWHNATLKEV